MGKMIAALKDRHVLLGLIGEFVGVMLFQFLAGSLYVVNRPGTYYPDLNNAETVAILALGNGLLFAVLVYLVRHTSGGHLNPAVTVAVTISGHCHILRGIFYIVAQVLGGIVGALGAMVLSDGPYCYDVEHYSFDKSWTLFGWETIMTFLLIMIVYSAVIAPGHGDVGPLVIGLTVTACTWAGAPKSGAALNPARVISPTIANMLHHDGRCHFDIFWYYIAAHAIAAVVAAVGALIVHGPGPHYTANRNVSRGRARGGIGQSLLESEGLQAGEDDMVA